MNFNDIELGKRYIESGVLYMVIGINKKTQEVKVIRLEDDVVFWFSSIWSSLKEYVERFDEEVNVISFEDDSILVTKEPYTFAVNGNCRRFKARLTEVL